MFDKICYKKNYLKEVIVRLDFIDSFDMVDANLPVPLKKRIIKNFPIFEPRKQAIHELKVIPGEITESQKDFNEWLFHGENGEKDLSISKYYFWVDYKAYTRYEDLRKESLEVILELFKQFAALQKKELQIKRLGLRYINNIEFEGDPLDWLDIINPALISPIEFKDKKSLIRSFHLQEYKFDDVDIKFQYGIINPDYPAIIRRKHFVLDFDASNNNLVGKLDIAKSIDNYHTKIQEFFETSVGEGLRKMLNE